MYTFFSRVLILIGCVVLAAAAPRKEKPTLVIIGDSTVKNGRGDGANGEWGWGDYLHEFMDTTRIHLENHALGGRSSRTFITQGWWEKALARVRPGDFVIMQFGHNDASAINDTSRARGTIKGIGEETEAIDNLLTGQHEVVHSYGWYLRQYIRETKARGATPIVCSLVPRNNWEDGEVKRATDSYATWAEQIAEETGVCYIDLNDRVATHYEALGPEKVASFFPNDHTHTDEAGARLNAQAVAEGLKALKRCGLKKYLR
ncbi:Lysophospholipase L1 [Catalinimonas alkaloidigena]|uniref:Lysophospholipase L1 n=1 Tax=Catalinimonas alkaloidigena TaxID=1075417 RepID=A0A1G9SJ46_9BACT|nr:rhamnogalacturonan acetylesterase [Catalinimonas alkaloidigena]SDM35524.1 Lysophospholipase L1 [Catalinimonas alkaloidigena]